MQPQKGGARKHNGGNNRQNERGPPAHVCFEIYSPGKRLKVHFRRTIFLYEPWHVPSFVNGQQLQSIKRRAKVAHGLRITRELNMEFSAHGNLQGQELWRCAMS